MKMLKTIAERTVGGSEDRPDVRDSERLLGGIVGSVGMVGMVVAEE